MSFKEKYLKYKNRYLALKLINIQGGVPPHKPDIKTKEEAIKFVSNYG